MRYTTGQTVAHHYSKGQIGIVQYQCQETGAVSVLWSKPLSCGASRGVYQPDSIKPVQIRRK